MPFGSRLNNTNSSVNSNSVASSQNSILAQTLFNPSNQIVFENNIQQNHSNSHHQHHNNHQQINNMNNLDYKNVVHHQQQPQQIQQHQQQQQHASEALIVQSNSNVVSDEILQQLHEQIGEGKQIYVLNSEDDDNVQYLIVDKDADISAILQDPSIFQAAAAAAASTNSTTNQANGNQIIQNQVLIQQQQQPDISTSQQQQQQQYIIVQDSNTSLAMADQILTNSHQNNNNKLNNLNASISSIEESIQRVSAPLPKRKTFEFQLENKKNSYQDAFLKYLAGEKQPSLEIIAEQVTS